MEEGARVISIKLLLGATEPVFYHSEYLVFDPARPLVEAGAAPDGSPGPVRGRPA